MSRVLSYIIPVLMIFVCYGAFYYLQNYQPDLLTAILVQADVFDLSDVARKEHARVAAINELPIHYEEKQVLLNHTVFVGATEDMVQLALGPPTKASEAKPMKNDQGEDVMVIYYVYYPQGNLHPIQLEFQQDKTDSTYKLVAAKNISALDWGN